MKTHSEYILAHGKQSDVARMMDVPVRTLRAWVDRDAIPPRYWLAFTEMSWRARVHVTLRMLAEAARDRGSK